MALKQALQDLLGAFSSEVPKKVKLPIWSNLSNAGTDLCSHKNISPQEALGSRKPFGSQMNLLFFKETNWQSCNSYTSTTACGAVPLTTKPQGHQLQKPLQNAGLPIWFSAPQLLLPLSRCKLSLPKCPMLTPKVLVTHRHYFRVPSQLNRGKGSRKHLQ